MWVICFVFLFLTNLRGFGVDAQIVDSTTHDQYSKSTIISDSPENCIFVSSETGYFTYKSLSNSSTVCGIYLMTGSQNLIEITFTEFDVPCDKNEGEGGLVQYLDGWELNKEVFPSADDISLNSIEDTEFCSDKIPLHKTFISSQNGAQILYRIPQIGKGFTIFVNHKKHPSPCNIIHFDEPYYLLQNHGKKRNCSLWASYPTAIQFNSYSVGDRKAAIDSSEQCTNSADHIEIGGGGFDTNRIQILDTVCGESNISDGHEDPIYCSSTTIKLVSSGTYDNNVNISMRPIDISENLIANAQYLCIPSIK